MMNKSTCNNTKEPLFQYVRDCYWTIFRGNTAILSSTCRQLALGIGSVLLLKPNTQMCSKIILTLLVLFFITDAGQYLYQSISFRNLAETYDKQIKADEITEVSKLIEPHGINYWTNRLFYLKLFCLAVATIFFIIFVWSIN